MVHIYRSKFHPTGWNVGVSFFALNSIGYEVYSDCYLRGIWGFHPEDKATTASSLRTISTKLSTIPTSH
jgi:hypothetical protein